MKKKTKDYTIKAKKVLYHPSTDTVVKGGNIPKGCIVFDSIYEYQCYRYLLSLTPIITVHGWSSVLKWYIDFTLTFSRKTPLPLELQNKVRLFRNKTLFVEAKGVITKDTVEKIRNLPPSIRDCVLIVCDTTHLLDLEGSPIIGLKKLEDMVNGKGST